MSAMRGGRTRCVPALFAVTGALALIGWPILAGREGSGMGAPSGPAQRLAGAAQMYASDQGLSDQCLANVKSITLAVQMYLTEWGRLPPDEHDPAALAYFKDKGAGIVCALSSQANPYLRWPVILDPYLETRDVWSCPAARLSVGARWIVPGPDWLSSLRKNENKWGMRGAKSPRHPGGPCYSAWPVGWGGTVTDSIAQGILAAPVGSPDSTGGFRQSIGCAFAPGLTKESAPDPAWFVVCGDSNMETIQSPLMLAYPEICHLAWRLAPDLCDVDWEACPWSQSCGLAKSDYERFRRDPGFRARYTRHLGGSNIGFLDGHAAWMLADKIIANAPKAVSGTLQAGRLQGVGPNYFGELFPVLPPD